MKYIRNFESIFNQKIKSPEKNIISQKENDFVFDKVTVELIQSNDVSNEMKRNDLDFSSHPKTLQKRSNKVCQFFKIFTEKISNNLNVEENSELFDIKKIFEALQLLWDKWYLKTKKIFIVPV